MGRGVSYLNNAETVIYFTVDGKGQDENGEFNDDICNMDYEDFESNLKYSIKAKLKSYEISDKWDNRETKILLENGLCIIGLSEYCGCYSLSVACRGEDYEAFALNHAKNIRNTLEKCLEEVGGRVMYKQGTFSNGESVFKYKETKGVV